MKTKKFPIDLSMLTEEEIDQFRQDPSTLFEGDTDVSLYLRFSSERQREQSIEGQLRDCRAYCKMNRYRITAIYVDRATTARKDVEKRLHFQEMIRDSEKRPWEYVVVWKLDRFARNRTDSALFKFRLRKNGVKVISATESISEKSGRYHLGSGLGGHGRVLFCRPLSEDHPGHERVGLEVPQHRRPCSPRVQD